jgi:hypothetical protein
MSLNNFQLRQHVRRQGRERSAGGQAVHHADRVEDQLDLHPGLHPLDEYARHDHHPLCPPLLPESAGM